LSSWLKHFFFNLRHNFVLKSSVMELGIGMFGDLNIKTNGTTQPTGERLKELIEEIKLMDETGIDFYGIGEHHRADYAVSAPKLYLPQLLRSQSK
jgi:hypothetical protein